MTDRAIKPKRGTKAQNDNYIGEEGEITVDTDTQIVRVHDGTTSGGHYPGSGHDLLVNPETRQTIPGDGNTHVVNFGLSDSETFDEGGMWDNSNNRFLAAFAGKYVVEPNIAFVLAEQVEYQVRINVNGSPVATFGSTPAVAGNTHRVDGSKEVDLAEGDEVEIVAKINSSASGDTDIGDLIYDTWLNIRQR
jgi:hypothetical protein